MKQHIGDIRGPQGLKGDKGDIGSEGPVGPEGQRGPKGAQGDKGDTGPEGQRGVEGLRGPKGNKGDAGPQGPEGPKGPKGSQGDQGLTGLTGTRGADGARGPKGDKGEPGPAGADGPPGADGPAGAGFNQRGKYVQGEMYHLNDLVSYKGQTWRAKGDVQYAQPDLTRTDSLSSEFQGADNPKLHDAVASGAYMEFEPYSVPFITPNGYSGFKIEGNRAVVDPVFTDQWGTWAAAVLPMNTKGRDLLTMDVLVSVEGATDENQASVVTLADDTGWGLSIRTKNGQWTTDVFEEPLAPVTGNDNVWVYTDFRAGTITIRINYGENKVYKIDDWLSWDGETDLSKMQNVAIVGVGGGNVTSPKFSSLNSYTSTAWPTWELLIPKAEGETGPQGPQGPKGDKGDAGPAGADSTVAGPKGDPGIPGSPGTPGMQGLQGPQGDPGPKGDTGAQGIQGLKGDKGDAGAQGIQGLKGDAGAQGIQGLKGDAGAQGIQGLKGDTGSTGPAGPGPVLLEVGQTAANVPASTPVGTIIFQKGV